jgi:hypothetical protein
MKDGNSGNNGSDLDKGDILKATFDTLTEEGHWHSKLTSSISESSFSCVAR